MLPEDFEVLTTFLLALQVLNPKLVTK